MNPKSHSLSKDWLSSSLLFYQITTNSAVEWNLFGRQLLKIKLIIPTLFTYKCIRLKVIPSHLDFTSDGELLGSEVSLPLHCYATNVIYSFTIISYLKVTVFFLGRHILLFINR